jgi:light-regulated signal transduction histidine kinase (bacteriophytochrome)
MGVLIDELLKFSRLVRRPVDKTSVDMDGMVRDIVEAALHEMPDDRVPPEIEVGALPRVMGDFVLLRQVWANLISNAIKYSAKATHPQISISGCTLRGEVVYSVRDNGAGFDMAFHERLFEPFQRAHHAREFEGTGIGLATVRRIVERHGGRVWAEGKVEQGARFHFALPV